MQQPPGPATQTSLWRTGGSRVEWPAASCGRLHALPWPPSPSHALPGSPSRAERGCDARAPVEGCLCTGVPLSQPGLPLRRSELPLPPSLHRRQAGLAACRPCLLPLVHRCRSHRKSCTDSVLVSVTERTQPVWGLHQARPLLLAWPPRRGRVDMLQAEESFPSVSSQLSGAGVNTHVLCRVPPPLAPFPMACGHSCSHPLRRKAALSPEHKGDTRPVVCASGCGCVGAGGRTVLLSPRLSPRAHRTSLGKGKQGLRGRGRQGAEGAEESDVR